MKAPAILETTLRDGSYVINFQFTASDTEVIAGELDRLGFPFIEVGHGIGLGASEAGMGQAAETDEGYMRAAAKAVKQARWGMFCIPGVAKLWHIDMAADYGMGFVRVGTNVTAVESSRPFIERAKKHGLFVSANFMKSYAMEPREFAQMARLTREYGSDVLCVVDSAGGMMTADVEAYFEAVREVTDIPLGFHGHNNLELAVANTLRAVEMGAAVVDTSLQGLGRSAGNTPTEIFLMALQRKGVSVDIDPLAVMDVGETYVKPLIRRHGYDSVDIVSGYAQFHSSYMGLIREFSGKYRVDPRRLIMAVCAQDKVNAPRELVERMAQKLAEDSGEVYTARFGLDRYFGAEQDGQS